MGCGTKMIKYLLFIFNLICALGGLAIIIIGAVIQWNINNYGESLGNQVYVPAIILLVVGCVIFVIAFFGCCGAAQESICMITTYSIFVVIILLIQVVCGIVILVYRDKIDIFIKNFMETQQDNYYKPGPEGDIAKEFWDNIQQDLQCCGVNSPIDWNGNVPETCKCSNLAHSECIGGYYSKGCYNKFIDIMHKLQTAIGAVAITIAVIELIAVIFACTLGSSFRRKRMTV